jgi:phosphatidate cytidylyltransferase
MLANRLKVVLIILPVGVFFIVLGGWAFAGLITLILGVAAWEFWRMFRNGGYDPSAWILIPGVMLLALSRQLWGFANSDAILAGLTMATMVYYTFLCSKGCQSPAIDFAITASGLLYLGWLGSFLISLRNLPNGLWWAMLALPIVAFGDVGAYFIGKRFGKHKLAPRVSPHKTIEGYLGGLAFALGSGVLLSLLWRLRFPVLTPLHGLMLGAILGLLAPLGDLAESMLKRQFNVKDTSNLLPGHGGVLDRMDSWLWGAAISFYVITWFF